MEISKKELFLDHVSYSIHMDAEYENLSDTQREMLYALAEKTYDLHERGQCVFRVGDALFLSLSDEFERMSYVSDSAMRGAFEMILNLILHE